MGPGEEDPGCPPTASTAGDWVEVSVCRGEEQRRVRAWRRLHVLGASGLPAPRAQPTPCGGRPSSPDPKKPHTVFQGPRAVHTHQETEARA